MVLLQKYLYTALQSLCFTLKMAVVSRGAIFVSVDVGETFLELFALFMATSFVFSSSLLIGDNVPLSVLRRGLLKEKRGNEKQFRWVEAFSKCAIPVTVNRTLGSQTTICQNYQI